jgi:major membrane immunogen (membrane-anchored lipoprotein)
MNVFRFRAIINPTQHRAASLTALAALVAGLLSKDVSGATELIQNGSFSAGMAGWKVAPSLAGWNPCSGSTVALYPPAYGYSGLVLYQNLNVPSVSGQTLTLSLGLQMVMGTSGKTIAVYLDYATASSQVKRSLVLNPDDSVFPTGFTNVSTTVTLPAEAAKLVRLVVAKMDMGQFNANLISLTSTGLTPGPVPVLASICPSAGGYYSATNSGMTTIRGSNFGTTTGQVWIATAPVEAAGLPGVAPIPTAQIASWNNTQIVARVVEPMASGKVYVLAGNVESQGECSFAVTSPTFTVSPLAPEITVVRGQKVTALFRVDFLNGFQTANGVSFMMTMPVYTPSSSLPLFRSGGCSFDIDTTSLANGVYLGTAQSMEDHSYARFTPFTLKVRSITNIVFSVGYPATPITSLTVTSQNEFSYNFSYALVDDTGATLTTSPEGPSASRLVTAVSDNPAVVQTIAGNFGPRYFAVGGGSANLVFTTANGYTKSLPVTANLPSAPRFIAAAISPSQADNSGLSTNSVYWQATEDVTWIGYEGMASFSFDQITHDYNNHSATWVFGVPAGTPPGTYVLDAELGNDSTMPRSYVFFDVSNTPSRGQIAGAILTVDSGSSFMMQETLGNLELYDATSGAGRSTNFIQNFNSSSYLASYLQPGSYKARWVPMNTAAAPQWYPQAPSFALATALPVQAGQTLSNVNFYVRPVPAAQTNLCLPAPVFNGSELVFSAPTIAGVTYILEYKDSLADSQWKAAQTITGTGNSIVLADAASGGPSRFYRLRMQTP